MKCSQKPRARGAVTPAVVPSCTMYLVVPCAATVVVHVHVLLIIIMYMHLRRTPLGLSRPAGPGDL